VIATSAFVYVFYSLLKSALLYKLLRQCPSLRRTITRLVERHYVRAHDTRRCSVAPQPQEHRIFDAQQKIVTRRCCVTMFCCMSVRTLKISIFRMGMDYRKLVQQPVY
jgi:hypothetical protein